MSDTFVLALEAAAWGVLSAISLVIGAVIGVWNNPKKEIRAVFMAYGSGALIEALSIELFAHIVDMANGNAAHRRLAEGPGKGLVYVAMACALLGGSCFAGLNKVLNDAGGFARHAASLKEQVGKRRLMFYDRLAKKLRKVPMFADLEMEELRQLASRMKKDVFEEGEIIFHYEDLHSPIFFLLSGSVRVDIFRVPEVSERSRSKQPIDSAPMEKPLIVKVDDTDPSHTYPNHTVLDVPDTDTSYMVQPHQLFGELAFITGQPFSANAVAVEVSKALKLLTHDFVDVVESNPKIKSFLANAAAQSIVDDKKINISMETLLQEMEVVVFTADELIYESVDQTTPIYYLILGHIRLTYESAGQAYPSTQDPMRTSNKRIIRPGKLFGTDNLVRGNCPQVTAVAHDKALALCLPNRDRWDRKPLPIATTCNKVAWSPALLPEISCPSTPNQLNDALTSPGQLGQLMPPFERVRSDRSANSVHSGNSPSCNRRRSSKMSVRSNRSIASVGTSFTTPTYGDNLRPAPEVTDAEVFEEASYKETPAIPGHVDSSGHHHQQNAHAAIMIWLGILIDAVPESVVLGILASTSSSGSLLTFVIGVFLSNLPEAMSSSGTMAACGVKRTRILLMWSSIVVLTGVGAATGAIIFPPGSEEKEGAQYAIAAIEGMCGGAMLTMIANTALPEAFEQGGNVVGLSTLLGFLSALFVSVASS